MQEVRTISRGGAGADSPLGARRGDRPAGRHGPRPDVAPRRGRRVVLLLILASIISAFDLDCTLAASCHECFVELNPIAAPIVGDPAALIAYKLLLWVCGVAIILAFRTRLLAEIGCWGVCAAYLGLAVTWWRFYGLIP